MPRAAVRARNRRFCRSGVSQRNGISKRKAISRLAVVINAALKTVRCRSMR